MCHVFEYTKIFENNKKVENKGQNCLAPSLMEAVPFELADEVSKTAGEVSGVRCSGALAVVLRGEVGVVAWTDRVRCCA